MQKNAGDDQQDGGDIQKAGKSRWIVERPFAGRDQLTSNDQVGDHGRQEDHPE